MAMHKFPIRHTALLAATLAVAGCGGGSSSSTAPTTVTGSVVKGPVNGAQVCAYAATSTGKGTQLGCTTTTASGAYSLPIEAVGDIIIEATGGTYTDEATSASRTLSDPMQVVLAGNAGGSVTGVITPLTSYAYTAARGRSGGVTSANFAAALTQTASSFGLAGTNLVTTVPAVTGTLNDYGRMLRAVSQFIANGGTLAHLQSGATPTELAAALQSAYATINGNNITINLASLGATTGTGGNTTGGSTTGGLTVSFAVNGPSGTSIPSVTVPGVPIPPAGTFCSSLNAANAQLAALAAIGTVSISGCNASGNTYTVNVNVQPTGVPSPFMYTVTYAFS